MLVDISPVGIKLLSNEGQQCKTDQSKQPIGQLLDAPRAFIPLTYHS